MQPRVDVTLEIELLTRFFAAINANDMDGMAAHFADDVVRVEPAGHATSAVYRGALAIKECVRTGRATWAEGACLSEAFYVNGDKVVVFLHAHVRVHGASAWSGGRFADGFVLRDERIAEYRTFHERDDALKWAGIA
ncbi:MAG: nuclear transport factor 2 family protein [Burkholderiales bacterium]|nr:nuclear transport factor 2 family protein [Burkholderiales bacterium]